MEKTSVAHTGERSKWIHSDSPVDPVASGSIVIDPVKSLQKFEKDCEHRFMVMSDCSGDQNDHPECEKDGCCGGGTL